VIIALLILGVAVTSLAKLLSAAAAQRRASEQRRLALQEVANLAERIALIPYGEVSTENLAALKPSGELLAAVPLARLTATQSPQAGPPEHKRVRLEVLWTDAAGQPVDPVGLTLWKHPPAEATP
jgi:hypothetical protein